MSIKNEELFLSAQRALLGNVTSGLRALSVNTYENVIEVYFFYDGEIDEEKRELAESIMDEIIADFWYDNEGKEIEFDYKIKRLDFPKKMPLKGFWVYYRYEDSTQYPDT